MCAAFNFTDNKTKITYTIVHNENNIFDVSIFRKYASYIRFHCASAQTKNTDATALLWSWLCLLLMNGHGWMEGRKEGETKDEMRLWLYIIIY